MNVMATVMAVVIIVTILKETMCVYVQKTLY